VRKSAHAVQSYFLLFSETA